MLFARTYTKVVRKRLTDTTYCDWRKGGRRGPATSEGGSESGRGCSRARNGYALPTKPPKKTSPLLPPPGLAAHARHLLSWAICELLLVVRVKCKAEPYNKGTLTKRYNHPQNPIVKSFTWTTTYRNIDGAIKKKTSRRLITSLK